MGWSFRCGSSSKNSSPGLNPTRTEFAEVDQEERSANQEVLLQIPSCIVHLMDRGEAIELSNGKEFTLLTISDENIPLATIINVGDDIRWPLTKDEPVVKLDPLHYLFSLPVKDGDPLSYGVSFTEDFVCHLEFLDKFLEEHSCFSTSSTASSVPNRNNLDWKEFAPRVNDYNNFLAKAIAGGTGHIVRGIFICSNAYTDKVQKGGEMIMTGAAEQRNGSNYLESYGGSNIDARKKSAVNASLKRVRKVSKMTEKISKKLLDGVQFASGSVMAPVVKSKAGKSFLKMVPGEVLLASLDAFNKVLDAAEAAEKQARTATSKATKRMVSRRFGESAGEATGDALATAGHCVNTAWNVFKIRKAINPASSVSTGVLKNAGKVKKQTSYS